MSKTRTIAMTDEQWAPIVKAAQMEGLLNDEQVSTSEFIRRAAADRAAKLEKKFDRLHRGKS